jgi:glycosyltransferase involved in cell wall biosynthesis
MPTSVTDRIVNVLFLSIVPSPYQRDLFSALKGSSDVSLRVEYAEAGSPDSPWPREALADYESVCDSFYLSWGGKRFIINRQLPDLRGVDIVVLNGYVTIPAQWVLRFKASKLPVIFWAEKMAPSGGAVRRCAQKFLAAPLGGLAAIVAIGKAAGRDYKERYPTMPVYELPYYCRLDAFQETLPERPREPVTLLFCGQMITRKGVDLLLEAFHRLVSEGQDIRLLLVGREAELPGMLKEIPRDIREKIEYAGFQAPESLPMFFSRADIFVLPSRYDGWGVVVNQALGAGLPVICSDAVGSAEDLVEPDGNGYIFRSGDAGGLADGIRRLVKSPGMLRQFAARSLEKSGDIQPDQGARDWVGILQETVERYHARTSG